MIDLNNLPPPSGENPGRFAYTQNSIAPVWVEDPWWKRVPWVIVLMALGVIAAFLAVL